MMNQSSPHTPSSTPAPTTVPASGRTASQPEEKPQNNGKYGVAEYRNGFGCRFIAADLSEAQAVALCEAARAVGCRPCSTSHFLTESVTH